MLAIPVILSFKMNQLLNYYFPVKVMSEFIVNICYDSPDESQVCACSLSVYLGLLSISLSGMYHPSLFPFVLIFFLSPFFLFFHLFLGVHTQD